MALSSNWKTLQKKIKKDGKAAAKPKGISKPKPRPKHVVKSKPQKDKPDSAGTRRLDPIEASLWLHEDDITVFTLSQSVAITDSLKDLRKQAPGKYLAIDCEFVGVGPEGRDLALARVSVVNYYGHVILDTFVKPNEPVTDWRTWVLGVTAGDMHQAIEFKEAQKKVDALLQGKILVGHALGNDLEVLFLSHPKTKIRDTAKFKPFRDIAEGKAPSLKKLCKHFTNLDIQTGQHSSVEDARATMLLFRMHRKEFERRKTREDHE